MNKPKLVSLLLLIVSSCDKSPSRIGEYVYMEGRTVHSVKDCVDAKNTNIVKSRDLFENTHKHLGKFYSNKEPTDFWDIEFCGACISESMMSAIDDSIAQYDNHYNHE